MRDLWLFSDAYWILIELMGTKRNLPSPCLLWVIRCTYVQFKEAEPFVALRLVSNRKSAEMTQEEIVLIFLPEDFKRRENPASRRRALPAWTLFNLIYVDVPSLSLANVNKLTHYKQIHLWGRQSAHRWGKDIPDQKTLQTNSCQNLLISFGQNSRLVFKISTFHHGV